MSAEDQTTQPSPDGALASGASSMRYSVLDLAPITEGSDVATALQRSAELAQRAEALGFYRFWLAEHHNMPGIASSATAVAISHVAQATRSIRVGAGGVMLPNHAPLVIAEQFGTLAALFPGRIDLGLGRAPGTDQNTAGALRRTLHSDPNAFPQDVAELLAYLGDPQPGQRVHAVPGEGSKVPVWILGSSLFGAQLAAMLGLPYAFASHFAPGALMQALQVYRDHFRPSEYLAAPYVMLGFNVCAADTLEEAKYLRTSSLQAVLRMRTGQPGQLPPPVRDFEETLSPADEQMLAQFTRCSAVGDQAAVESSIRQFVVETQANELMIVGQIFSHEARLHSYEIAAAACQAVAQTTAA